MSIWTKIGLAAETEVAKVESVVGIVSAATKESLKNYFATKEYTVTITAGFNGEKFYALAPDGTEVKSFDTYEELVAFVDPTAVVAPIAPVPVVAVEAAPAVAAIDPALLAQEVSAQAEIDAALAKLAALKAQEAV
jgi:hypothetical protein